MAAPALDLDLSGIAVGQPRIPDPIANALSQIQTVVNSLGNVHIAADAAIDLSKLAAGILNAGTYLTFVGARAARTGDLNNAIPNNTDTAVSMTEIYDPGNHMVSTVFTAPVTGYYHISAQIAWVAANYIADAQYFTRIWKNGVTSGTLVASSGQLRKTDNNNRLHVPLSTTVLLTAGDTITPAAFHVDGGQTADIYGEASGASTYFAIHLIAR